MNKAAKKALKLASNSSFKVLGHMGDAAAECLQLCDDRVKVQAVIKLFHDADKELTALINEQQS